MSMELIVANNLIRITQDITNHDQFHTFFHLINTNSNDKFHCEYFLSQGKILSLLLFNLVPRSKFHFDPRPNQSALSASLSSRITLNVDH